MIYPIKTIKTFMCQVCIKLAGSNIQGLRNLGLDQVVTITPEIKSKKRSLKCHGVTISNSQIGGKGRGVILNPPLQYHPFLKAMKDYACVTPYHMTLKLKYYLVYHYICVRYVHVWFRFCRAQNGLRKTSSVTTPLDFFMALKPFLLLFSSHSLLQF